MTYYYPYYPYNFYGYQANSFLPQPAVQPYPSATSTPVLPSQLQVPLTQVVPQQQPQYQLLPPNNGHQQFQNRKVKKTIFLTCLISILWPFFFLLQIRASNLQWTKTNVLWSIWLSIKIETGFSFSNNLENVSPYPLY